MTPPEPVPEDRGQEKPATHHRNPWGWPVAWMVSVLVLALSAVYIFKSCRDLPLEAIDKGGRAVENIGRQLEQVAAAFRQGTITTTFTSYATTISGSQCLQFATLNQIETFTRKDEATVAFGYVPLPDVIVEATAPVSYTYYLDWNERWEFRLEDHVLLVIAPDIHYNKPAVDASRISYVVKKNSLLRNTTEARENLKNSITSMAHQKARDNIALVRETGRTQTAAFIQNWLGRNFSDGKIYAVKVRFRNELQAPGGAVLPPATNLFEGKE